MTAHDLKSMNPSVTLETKCWENDWEFLLKTDRIERMAERSGFNFAKRTLFINNVDNPGKVRSFAEKLVRSGVLTGLHIVAEPITDSEYRSFGMYIWPTVLPTQVATGCHNQSSQRARHCPKSE